MKKNVSGQKVGAQMVSASDGSAFTGSVTVSVTGDAGTQATGSVGSGACTHEGNGYHTYAPAQAETNYDLVAFTFTGTGAVPQTVQIYTAPTTGVLAPTDAGRTLDVTATGAAGIDWGNVENKTTSNALTGTTIAATQQVDVNTIKTQTVTCAAGVTVLASVGTAATSTAQTGDAYAVVNHGTHGNSAIKTQTAAIETDTQDIQSRLPAALVNSRMDCTIDGTGMETGAVDNILNRDASGSTTNSTLGAIVNDWENGGRLDLIVDAILDDTDLIDDGTSGLAKIATDVAAILVDTGTTLDDLIDAIKAVTDKIDDTLEDNAGTYRFTEAALAEGPGGGGGGGTDWDADERTAIRAILGIPGSGTTPADPSAGILDTIRDAIGVVDNNVDSILADTNELQTDWANGGRLDLLLDATLADTNELQTDWANGGRLDLLLDATLADTNELQTDWANGGRLDLILDARASQTSVDTIDNNVDSILVDTANMQDTVEAGVVQVLTAEDVTDFTAIPSGTPTYSEALGFIYAISLNRHEVTATTATIFDSDNNAVAEAAVSDDGTTFTRTKYTAP